MLFWKYSPPSWIKNMKRSYWIEQSILDLIGYYGFDYFYRKCPIIMSKDFAPFLFQGHEIYLSTIANEMVDQARIKINEVKINVFREYRESNTLIDSEMCSFEVEKTNTAGVYHEIDRYGSALISVEARNINDSIFVCGVLAHELSHVFLDISRPFEPFWDREEEEDITDLMAVILGLGIYMVNSKERFFYDGQFSGKASLGYLTLEETCYAQAYLSNFYQQEFNDYRHLLFGKTHRYIQDAITYFEKRKK